MICRNLARGAKSSATLRPAGKIVVNDQIYDAVSTGDFINAGETVDRRQLEGSVIVVNRESGGMT